MTGTSSRSSQAEEDKRGEEIKAAKGGREWGDMPNCSESGGSTDGETGGGKGKTDVGRSQTSFPPVEYERVTKDSKVRLRGGHS